jgi:hypothetical protein
MIDEMILTWIIILFGFASFLMGSLITRRHRTPLDLRPIEGYQILPVAVDEAVESARRLHLSLGASAVGQETTLAALAGAEVMYHLIRRMSFTRQLPLVTMSDPVTLAVTEDTLRKAYLSRDNLTAYHPTAAVWYPQGERSLAFAAGVSSLAADIDAPSHVMLGTFGSEIAYFGESSMRREQRLVANSIVLEGQAVAYGMADASIIGEELFVGGAYLNRDNTAQMGSLIALDTLRWGIIVFGILLGILVNAVD